MKKLTLSLVILFTLFSLAYTQTAEEYNKQARESLESGNLKDAVILFSKAIELKPDYLDAYFTRGAVYVKLKEYTKAIQDFRKTIGLNPDDYEAYYNLGLIYDRLEDYSKAISEYNKAIEINPQYAVAYNNLGVIYYDLGDLNKACEEWRKASALGYTDAKDNIDHLCK